RKGACSNTWMQTATRKSEKQIPANHARKQQRPAIRHSQKRHGQEQEKRPDRTRSKPRRVMLKRRLRAG
ncbi:MAG TPA: hypothetical protein PKD31_28365, partial [Blastocatellia bacterium]|nr:hypothetical protein [Blastocatellia bacterium]